MQLKKKKNNTEHHYESDPANGVIPSDQSFSYVLWQNRIEKIKAEVKDLNKHEVNKSHILEGAALCLFFPKLIDKLKKKNQSLQVTSTETKERLKAERFSRSALLFKEDQALDLTGLMGQDAPLFLNPCNWAIVSKLVLISDQQLTIKAAGEYDIMLETKFNHGAFTYTGVAEGLCVLLWLSQI